MFAKHTISWSLLWGMIAVLDDDDGNDAVADELLDAFVSTETIYSEITDNFSRLFSPHLAGVLLHFIIMGCPLPGHHHCVRFTEPRARVFVCVGVDVIRGEKILFDIAIMVDIPYTFLHAAINHANEKW